MPDIFGNPTLAEMANPRRRERRTSLTEADLPPSLLTRVMRPAISGLASAGNLLDLPGSMMRDVLSGENPFDQILSPISPENRVSGRQMLEKWGVLGRNKPGFDWGDVAGFGADVLTDPTTYLSGGMYALTKGGKALRAAGLTDDLAEIASKQFNRQIGPREARMLLTPEHVIDAAEIAGKTRATAYDDWIKAGGDISQLTKPIGGNLGVGFINKTIGTLDLPYGKSIARGVDMLAESLRYGQWSPLRPAAALFSKGTRGAISAVSQKMFSKQHRLAERAVAESREKVAEMAMEFEKQGYFDIDALARSTGLTPHDAALQIYDRSQKLIGYIEDRYTAADVPSWSVPYLDEMKRIYNDMPNQEQAKGLISSMLDEAYGKRMPIWLDAQGRRSQSMANSPFAARHPSQIARHPMTRGNPGGTEVLNDMAVDPDFQRFREASAARRVKSKGSTLTKQDINDLEALILTKYERQPGVTTKTGITLERDPVTNQLTDAGKEKLRALAVHFGTLHPDHVTKVIPMYEPNPFKSFLARTEHGARAMQTTDAVVAILSDPSVLRVGGAYDMPKVVDVLRDMDGISNDRMLERIAEKLGWTPSPTGMDARTFLSDKYVPQRVAKDVVKSIRGFTHPDELTPFVEAWDRFTGFWKSMQTSMWPRFHVRNLLSGQFQNYQGDAFSADSFIKSWQIQKKGTVLKGIANAIPDFRNLTDAEATERLRQEFFAWDITGYRKGFTPENLGEAVGTPFGGIPGTHPRLTKAPVGTTFGQQLNPLQNLSMTGESRFWLERKGHDIAKLTEGMNRGTSYIELRKRGWTQEAAAARVAELQVDYKNLSDFERLYMKRLMPFYAFTRGVIPPTVEELVTRPGGIMAQTVKEVTRLRGADEYTPDYVAETVSLPLGQLSDGTRRYLSGLGLMFEDPLQLSPISTSGIQGTLLEAISRFHPLPKALIEWGTGEVTFQHGPEGGRSIKDLDPTLGRLVANLTGQQPQQAKPLFGSRGAEYIAGNLIGQPAFMARTITDPRKREDPLAMLLNLASGARISHISPAAQDARIRELAGEMMQKLGGKTFEKAYIPEEAKAEMSAEELRHATGLELLNTILANRAKARKQEAAKKK